MYNIWNSPYCLTQHCTLQFTSTSLLITHKFVREFYHTSINNNPINVLLKLCLTKKSFHCKVLLFHVDHNKDKTLDLLFNIAFWISWYVQKICLLVSFKKRKCDASKFWSTRMFWRCKFKEQVLWDCMNINSFR